MRVIIAGSRSIDDPIDIRQAVRQSGFIVSEVVSGGARGADRLGEYWAEENGVPCQRFPADWETFGKPAGIIRNVAMAKYADALIAIWDGRSNGTKHMIDTATGHGLQVFVYQPGKFRENDAALVAAREGRS